MNPLSFCLPIEPPAQGGGGFAFLRLFEKWLKAHGHKVTRYPSDGADVLFLNSWHSGVWSILRARWANKKVVVVHRVDGSAVDYGRSDGAKTDGILARINAYVDLTIYQSIYAASVLYPKLLKQPGRIIYNPVDPETFKPDGPQEALLDWPGWKVAVVAWSPNPMKGAPEVYAAAAHNPDTLFVLCGRYDGGPSAPNVYRAGVLDHVRLAAHLRGCDALLTFARNEACPNHVIEAMACGLPIIYRPSGALAELVGRGLYDPAWPASAGVAIETPEDFTPALWGRLGSAAEASVARIRARHLPDVVFGRYLRAIDRVIDPVPMRKAEML